VPSKQLDVENITAIACITLRTVILFMPEKKHLLLGTPIR
jgi:hypothetical protein